MRVVHPESLNKATVFQEAQGRLISSKVDTNEMKVVGNWNFVATSIRTTQVRRRLGG